jgi:hypothetical protein
MENTVEQQINDYLGVLLDGLKQAGHVREVAQLSDLLVQAKVTPSIGYNIGPEVMILEDNCGYLMEATLAVRIWLHNYRNEAMAKQALSLKGEAQALLEADDQFGGLIVAIKYSGDEKYIDTKQAKPAGGIYLLYRLQYRRKRAQPEVNY